MPKQPSTTRKRPYLDQQSKNAEDKLRNIASQAEQRHAWMPTQIVR